MCSRGSFSGHGRRRRRFVRAGLDSFRLAVGGLLLALQVMCYVATKRLRPVTSGFSVALSVEWDKGIIGGCWPERTRIRPKWGVALLQLDRYTRPVCKVLPIACVTKSHYIGSTNLGNESILVRKSRNSNPDTPIHADTLFALVGIWFLSR